MNNNKKIIEFVKEFSWGEKTTYFYPPWEYMERLENVPFESIQKFKDIDISQKLNLYFHFPKCQKKCPFCTYPTHNIKQFEQFHCSEIEYENALLNELRLWLNKLSNVITKKKVELNSIYIGGGSPSLWFLKDTCFDFFDRMNEILEAKILSDNPIDSIQEITFEIHPLSWNENLLNNLKDRFDKKLKLSLGMQSFIPKSIEIIRDIQEKERKDRYINKSLEVIDWTLQNKIYLNIDFMWGLKNNSIENELRAIENNLKDNLSRINQFTFYRIWRPSDLDRDQKYKKYVEIDYYKTREQRERLFDFIEKWGFRPDIYIEYFTNKKGQSKNIYNQGQMNGSDYLAFGPNVHGKIGNLLYMNTSDFVGYLEKINNYQLPIKNFQFLNNEGFEKQKILLSLRIPEREFSERDLKEKLGLEDDIIGFYFEKKDGFYILNKDGILDLPEVLLTILYNDFINNKAWQIREHHSITNRIEDVFKKKYFSFNFLESIFKSIVLDYYKTLNSLIELKIEVCNIAYFSQFFSRPIFGDPQGAINIEEWEKMYNIWSEDEDKISLYEIFFNNITDVGVPCPLKIDKQTILSEEKFYNFFKEKIQLKKNKARSDIDSRVEKIRNLFKLFLGKREQCNYVYFIGIRTSNYFTNSGGIIISTIQSLRQEESILLGSTLESFFSVINRSEYQYEMKVNSIKSSITAILVDSFSHNVSAHSLSAIVWLYMKRNNLLENRFMNSDLVKKIKNNFQVEDEKIKYMPACKIKKISTESAKDYEKLGLSFTKHNDDYFSMNDLLKYAQNIDLINFFEFDKLRIDKTSNEEEKPRLPIPLDRELVSLFKFLKGKAAFWNGVYRDTMHGGERMSWFDLLYDFGNNPLFLGTIAHSEGINKVEIKVGYDGGNDGVIKLSSFMTINLTNLIKEKSNSSEGNKYVFLGNSFVDLKPKLENIFVFLPGGIVGKHSLYTIFENTIRNIKHVNGQRGLIEFNLTIKLIHNRLYEVTIWLGNKSTLRAKNIAKLKASISDSIITKTNQPKLGGSSQDKICAAMLYSNCFSNVENRDISYGRKKLFPWISYSGLKKGISVVKRKFYVWKGDVTQKIEKSFHFRDENISRFIFTIFQKKFYNLIQKKVYEFGLVRLFSSDELSDDKTNDKDLLYTKWNYKWLKIKGIKKNKIGIINNGKIEVKFEVNKKSNCWELEEKKYIIGNIEEVIPFSHGESSNSINKNTYLLSYRNHGVLINLFLNLLEGKKKSNSQEFIETLFTKIFVIDNRIFQIVKEKEKIEIFKENLFLEINNEKFEINAFKRFIKKNECNFIILHLAYIESIKDFEESNLDKFIDKCFMEMNGYLLNHNTKLVITTGRGRQLWRDCIKGKPYSSHILFKPIESIQNAVEHGLILNDDFTIKYNLLKVLFGS